MSGKGDMRRQSAISQTESDLRWCLAFAKTDAERDSARLALEKFLGDRDSDDGYDGDSAK